MELDVQIVGLAGEKVATTKAIILPCIRELAAICGVNEDRIGRFVVADETHYITAVQAISAAEVCTDGNGLLGVGKTISTSDERGTTTDHIVVRAEMVGAMMEGANTGKPLGDWPVDCQTGAYVIAHEFGHCRDNSERPGALKVAPLDTRTFRISEFRRYYGSIAVTEYAASYFAASVVAPRLFSEFLIQDADSVRSLGEQAHRKRREYTGTDQLFGLACTAASAYWLSIIQAVKLFGVRKGNPTLQSVPIHWSGWFFADVGNVLQELEASLSEVWDGYPAADARFIDCCQASWGQIALAEGFKFFPNPAPTEIEGDGVFFNT